MRNTRDVTFFKKDAVNDVRKFPIQLFYNPWYHTVNYRSRSFSLVANTSRLSVLREG
jgi:hypothetical protein